jgi:hypothetical protein
MIVGVMIVGVISVGVMTVGALSVGVMTLSRISDPLQIYSCWLDEHDGIKDLF